MASALDHLPEPCVPLACLTMCAAGKNEITVIVSSAFNRRPFLLRRECSIVLSLCSITGCTCPIDVLGSYLHQRRRELDCTFPSSQCSVALSLQLCRPVVPSLSRTSIAPSRSPEVAPSSSTDDWSCLPADWNRSCFPESCRLHHTFQESIIGHAFLPHQSRSCFPHLH